MHQNVKILELVTYDNLKINVTNFSRLVKPYFLK